MDHTANSLKSVLEKEMQYMIDHPDKTVEVQEALLDDPVMSEYIRRPPDAETFAAHVNAARAMSAADPEAFAKCQAIAQQSRHHRPSSHAVLSRHNVQGGPLARFQQTPDPQLRLMTAVAVKGHQQFGRGFVVAVFFGPEDMARGRARAMLFVPQFSFRGAQFLAGVEDSAAETVRQFVRDYDPSIREGPAGCLMDEISDFVACYVMRNGPDKNGEYFQDNLTVTPSLQSAPKELEGANRMTLKTGSDGIARPVEPSDEVPSPSEMRRKLNVTNPASASKAPASMLCAQRCANCAKILADPKAKKVCSKCCQAWYCDETCSKAHYPAHKARCQQERHLLDAARFGPLDAPFEAGVAPQLRKICEKVEGLANQCFTCGIRKGTPTIKPVMLRSCGRCHMPRYCGTECQRTDWSRHHKHDCAKLRDKDLSLLKFTSGYASTFIYKMSKKLERSTSSPLPPEVAAATKSAAAEVKNKLHNISMEDLEA
mmetsp:Transcript_1527/g.3086  ORF Transcript_1527/g.3086 Transcript_1527/m.3086 type:complete len:485 (+) Transcript_1527:81-1535(+)